MRANEFLSEATKAVKQRLDPKCWKGKHKEGTKIKGGVRVNNCVPNESVEESQQRGMQCGMPNCTCSPGTCKCKPIKGWIPNKGFKAAMDEAANAAQQAAIAIAKKKKKVVNEGIFDSKPKVDWNKRTKELFAKGLDEQQVAQQLIKEGCPPKQVNVYVQAGQLEEDWNKVNKKDKTDGLSQKAVNAYRRENPGSKLKTAVTTKPSKLKAGSKDAKRRKSFCARMSGNKGPMKKPNGKPTPKALALRRWNCESVEEMVNMIIENMNHAKDNQAVPELKAALLSKKVTLQKASEDQVYDIIDTLMTRIAKSHGISGQKLHDMWVKEYDQIPDTWIMK